NRVVHQRKGAQRDMVDLLNAAEVFKKANAKAEKWEKTNIDQTQGEQLLEKEQPEEEIMAAIQGEPTAQEITKE
nr:hypothetical protein [Tanacetum cinerariifolium]